MSEEIYTEDELDILHEVHASAKMRGPESNVYEQIRQRIPRISGNAARRAVWDLNHLGFVDMPRHASRERKCMSCSKTFVSEGPQNRLCSPCRLKAAEPMIL
tara:strand:+ start:242 stop:547 length:306 start_codon:yes stop_codon:yes gene_type:complete